MSHVGIDVAKASFQVAFHDTQAQRWRERRFENSRSGVLQCHRWLLNHHSQPPALNLEATGCYSEPLACGFHELGHRLYLINPAQAKHFARARLQRAKTDRLDARLLAELGNSPRTPAWQPPPQPVRTLRDLQRLLRGLQRTYGQLANRLETHDPITHDSLHRMLEHCHDEIQHTLARIAQCISSSPSLQNNHALLHSISGVGPATCRTLLTRLPTLQRCSRPQHLVAFAGLDPRPCESGSSIQLPRHISKCGDPELRKTLYLAALSALQHNPVIREFANRQRARGLRGKALVCAAARKLLHLIHGVLKSQKPFNPEIPLRAPG